jgi:hypothetical protein
MAYTLWCRGRLVGETELGSPQPCEPARMGWLRLSADGEKMMPILIGTSPIMRKLGRMLRDPACAVELSASSRPAWAADIMRTTIYADLMSMHDEVESLHLELRDPLGNVLDAEDIGIEESGESGFRRYRIEVRLREVARTASLIS